VKFLLKAQLSADTQLSSLLYVYENYQMRVPSCFKSMNPHSALAEKV